MLRSGWLRSSCGCSVVCGQRADRGIESHRRYKKYIMMVYTTMRRHRVLLGFFTLLLISLLIAVCAGAQANAQGDLKTTSQLIEQLVEKVNPAVVEIDVKGIEVGDPEKEPDRAGYLVHDHSMATGVILTQDGEILTNHHVVRGAQQITVHVLGSTRGYSARIIGDDPQADLALLKIDGSGLSHFELGTSARVRQGQIVLAMGNPFGFGHSVTLGLISSPSRELDGDSPTNYIQTDASINPGNSGGPLVDLDGRLVGINTLIYSLSGGSEGVGFAIPAEAVAHSVTAMETYGSVKRPYLGVTLQPVTETLARGLNLAARDGFLVDDIEPGGPASRSGIATGDVIIAAQGKPLTDWKSLQDVLDALIVGQPLVLQTERNRLERAVSIQPRYEGPRYVDLIDYANVSRDSINQVGIIAVSLNAGVRHLLPETRSSDGIVIAAKCDGIGYDTSELEAGDILHQVNGRPIHDVAGLRSYLLHAPPREPLVLQVERNSQLKYIAITAND
jgi:serine protease Do